MHQVVPFGANWHVNRATEDADSSHKCWPAAELGRRE
jgi:hypothetical protein